MAGAGGNIKKSWVWEYMYAEPGKSTVATCKICEMQGTITRVPRHDSSTRDMIDHLAKHGITQYNRKLPKLT